MLLQRLLRRTAYLFFVYFVSVLQAHAASREVTYCVDPNWMPYEAIRDGKHIGISAEYLHIISEISDIHFQLVPTESWQQTLEYVRMGRCMVIDLLNASPSRKQYLDFTLPYFESPNVLVARDGTPMLQGYAGLGKRLLGVVKGYRHAEYLARYYPSVRVKFVESESQGLQQLAKGDIDVMVGSLLSVNATINNLGLNGLIISGYAEPYDSMGFGVNKAHSDLVPVLNDAILSIPEALRVDIFKRWNTTQVQRSYNYGVFALVVAIFASLLAVYYWRKRTLEHFDVQLRKKNEEMEVLQSALLEKNRTLEFLSTHDSTTGLYNRNYMMHKAEEEVSRFQRFHTSASLIVLELDNINVLNQKHGVNSSDDILKQVSSACVASVREVDIVGRWSGEQFMVLCPQTDITAAKILADRLLQALNEHPSQTIRSLNVAIGLSVLENAQTFTDWYDKTVKALFQSKRQGFSGAIIAD